MSKFDKSKYVNEAHKKTIRFDDNLYRCVAGYAQKYGLTFSSAVKNQLAYNYRNFQNIGVEAKITPQDRMLLGDLLILYSRSATNLNQGVKAMNELRNLSWLDLSQGELDNKLDSISSQLSKVNENFSSYEDILNKFIKRVKKVR